jgi:hypothetical protein
MSPKEWVLVIMLLAGPNHEVKQVHSIEFSTKARCELAMRNIRANAEPTILKMYCAEG